MKKFQESELPQIASAVVRECNSFIDDIKADRERALDDYKQELYGNEVEGRSSVITSDVRDTIEAIKPSLIEVFLHDETCAEFIPTSKEDVEAAKQETKAVRHAIFRQNSGFLIFNDWFSDALLQKNGIVKAYWDEGEETNKETYEGLSHIEFLKLLEDENLEVSEHTFYINEEEQDEDIDKDDVFAQIEAGLIPVDIITHDVVIKEKRDTSQVRIKSVPPENFGINRSHSSVIIAECDSCYEEAILTISDLVADGYDFEKLKDIPSEEAGGVNDESISRNEDVGADNGSLEDYDIANRRIKVCEVYCRIDINGDGVAELIKIVTAGIDNSVVLDWEEVSCIPYYSLSPYRLTHRFYGMSVADFVSDIQKIRTTLLRQVLDNIYLTNSPRTKVLSGSVEMRDLLTTRPGGVVRVKDMNAVQELTVPFTAGNTLPIFDLLDRMLERKTGVGDQTQGLNPDALSNATNFVGGALIDRAMQRIKMIASMFAETGIKELFLGVQGLLAQHATNAFMMEVSGEFVEVDPRQWKKRTDMHINVGVGYADKREKQAALDRILVMQEKIIANGGLGRIVTENNIYDAIKQSVQYSGILDCDKYFTDPSTVPPPPPPAEQPIDAAVEIEQAKVTIDSQEKASRLELDKQKHADNMKLETAKLRSKETMQDEKLIADAAELKEELRYKYTKD